MSFGLFGKNLSHSLSKQIHTMFGNNDYEVYNVDKPEDIFSNKNMVGFNITIPYKTLVIPYLNNLDKVAQETNSVNTIIRKDDKLYGYNTDYYGFIQTLKYFKVKIKEKNVLLLGNGSVSETVFKALKDFGAKKVLKLCRTKRGINDILFSEFNDYENYDIIINTTPVGMFPHNDDIQLINLSSFTKLHYVIDLIYNPFKTKLLVEAEKLDIKAINGLYMLVMQAKKANELFFNKAIPLNKANQIYYKLKKNLYNLVFIGLPLSGKSKYAKLVGTKLHKNIIDIDNVIEGKTDMKISDIFTSKGESEFRNLETQVVNDIYKFHNQCISTGGGLIKNKNNIDKLKQNGVIIFLDKDPLVISKKEIFNRPLIKSGEDILKLAKERLPIYNSLADVTVKIYKDTNSHIKEIKEMFYEYINS